MATKSPEQAMDEIVAVIGGMELHDMLIALEQVTANVIAQGFSPDLVREAFENYTEKLLTHIQELNGEAG